MKKQMIFGALTLALLACSDSDHAGGSITDVNTLASDDSSSSVEEASSSSVENQSSSSDLPFVPEESSSSVVESSSSSVLENRYPHGINPLEGTVNKGVVDDSGVHDYYDDIAWSSSVAYYFNTDRSYVFYEYLGSESSGILRTIGVYEEEDGILASASDGLGFYRSTSRIVESPTEKIPYVVKLWSNTYYKAKDLTTRKETCARDLKLYEEECKALHGDFVSYSGCVALELSCVYPNNLDVANNEEALKILAEQEKDYLEKYWNNVAEYRSDFSGSGTSSSSSKPNSPETDEE